VVTSSEERLAARYGPVFDFSVKPTTKAGWVVRVFVTVVSVAMLYRTGIAKVGPMLRAKAPPRIPTEQLEGDRFGIPEHVRRAIFTEVAAAEIAERKRAIDANTWGGHAWSREDDRGYYERIAVRAAAAKHNVSLPQVYLVLDEGIRQKWLGPDGKPLAGTTPPLSIRSESW
jgi:hypothetical protein